jgi:uncharacterized lipoprotein YddW (UPF0748 family)
MLAALALTIIWQTSDLDVPKAQREFRGVWVATVDNIDWPSTNGLTTQKQKEELIAILDNCERLNLNAVIFQVRPSCDALYDSKLEPWSEYLTGKQGKAPNPKWDPLKFAIEEAHKRGLELHAWFNPYRAKHPSMKDTLSPKHIAKRIPKVVKFYGRFMWLDPGEPAVQKHTMAVFMDVVKRYDVDGIHIDDYFYPYPVKENGKIVPFPDTRSYRAYRKKGGKLAVDDWRRKNVDDFVEKLYKNIKKVKPWVKFGISPFGIYRPGMPPSIKAGIDQYAELYADCLKWLQKGWCDYMTPQLYWAIDPPEQSYPVLLDWWVSVNEKGRHIWPGLFTSRINEGVTDWPIDEIINQIEVTRNKEGASGNVHFSMRALMQNWKGIADGLSVDAYSQKALVPQSKWLDAKVPDAPKNIALAKGSDGDTFVKWASPSSPDVRFAAIYVREDENWKLERVVGAAARFAIVKSFVNGGKDVRITFLDRCGNESAPAPAIR